MMTEERDRRLSEAEAGFAVATRAAMIDNTIFIIIEIERSFVGSFWLPFDCGWANSSRCLQKNCESNAITVLFV